MAAGGALPAVVVKRPRDGRIFTRGVEEAERGLRAIRYFRPVFDYMFGRNVSGLVQALQFDMTPHLTRRRLLRFVRFPKIGRVSSADCSL